MTAPLAHPAAIDYTQYPDAAGHFGRHGGRFVAETLIGPLPELAAAYGVRSIPTLAMFKGGEVADIKVGAAPKTALSSWISSAA